MKLFELDKTTWFHIILIIVSLLAVYISIKFLGRDNPVEKIAVQIIEIELKLPPDPKHLDLVPEISYVDNT